MRWLDRAVRMRLYWTVVGTGILVTQLQPLRAENGAALDELLRTFVREQVAITPGRGPFPSHFRMGSEGGPAEEMPAHDVSMVRPFFIGRYEVPQNLYQAVMGNNPSRWKGPRNGADSMTQREAQQFCARITQLLSERKLIGSSEVIRLPTEAEWEYCCRAGTRTKYSFGDAAQSAGDTGDHARVLDRYAWHKGNAAGNDPAVGALQPNPWGLYDMHGYLWEYCEDAWHDNYTHAPRVGRSAWDGDRGFCVVRGGSWKDPFDRLRCAARRKSPRTLRDDAIGFRCVRAAR